MVPLIVAIGAGITAIGLLLPGKKATPAASNPPAPAASNPPASETPANPPNSEGGESQ